MQKERFKIRSFYNSHFLFLSLSGSSGFFGFPQPSDGSQGEEEDSLLALSNIIVCEFRFDAMLFLLEAYNNPKNKATQKINTKYQIRNFFISIKSPSSKNF